MFEVVPMPWDWPVVINYHEGKAFCAWKGPDYRLPCEAEHRIIRGTQVQVMCLPFKDSVSLKDDICHPDALMHPHK